MKLYDENLDVDELRWPYSRVVPSCTRSRAACTSRTYSGQYSLPCWLHHPPQFLQLPPLSDGSLIQLHLWQLPGYVDTLFATSAAIHLTVTCFECVLHMNELLRTAQFVFHIEDKYNHLKKTNKNKFYWRILVNPMLCADLSWSYREPKFERPSANVEHPMSSGMRKF